jgi:hypothetical protein
MRGAKSTSALTRSAKRTAKFSAIPAPIEMPAHDRPVNFQMVHQCAEVVRKCVEAQFRRIAEGMGRAVPARVKRD